VVDLRKMAREFALNEGRKVINWQALIQSVDEALNGIRTSSLRDSRRVELAKHNLREVKKHLRRANEKIETLEEQLRILEEGNKKEE